MSPLRNQHNSYLILDQTFLRQDSLKQQAAYKPKLFSW